MCVEYTMVRKYRCETDTNVTYLLCRNLIKPHKLISCHEFWVESDQNKEVTCSRSDLELICLFISLKIKWWMVSVIQWQLKI